ncbi:adhesion G protein-coupled receptor G3 isoform X1 [Corvus cornix cornix]|uniref:adhesion G protein-coupled receptor G3 isoform X1 n=1 Tax=Corvus cornix cornix TaxID=932674 RepID=UPI00194FE834|nr:adhesion G protein-coupled receptor G3 isoform X1 [Corvus cornix cornix]
MRNGCCLGSGHKPRGSLGRSKAAGTRGAECGGMARGSQETPQSGMNLFLGTVLLLLLLTDVAKGRDSCSALFRGDEHHECCNVMVKQQDPGNITHLLHLSRHCLELWHSESRACACLRERLFRLLQSGQHSLLEGLKTLLLSVSREDVTRDVLITFSPTAGPSRLNTTEKGETGKIHLPREIFRSLSSQTVSVVVTVLDIQRLGMFKEVNQTAQVLDNTVVGITVGESSISGLQDPVKLTFAHRQLPHGVTLQCVFWDPSKGTSSSGAGQGTGAVPSTHSHPHVPVAGQAGGWSSSGCETQPGEKGTVCSCDHLTFFTLLLNPALDSSTAKALIAVATAGCGVAMAFAIFTIAFCIFIRCRFRFEETVHINLGLHVNLVGSLFLLNLVFLLNSGLSGRSHPRTCRVLGGLTHYCLLCCFTWTALEGCQLYLLFVKVLGIYIHHYLAKLCLIGWGFPILVVGVAGVIGSYGEYSIQNMEHQVIAHLCVCHCPQGSGGSLARGGVAQSCQERTGQGLHPSGLALRHASASLIVIATHQPPPPLMLSLLSDTCSPPGSWRDVQGPPGASPGSLPAEQHEGSDMHHCPSASPGLGKSPSTRVSLHPQKDPQGRLPWVLLGFAGLLEAPRLSLFRCWITSEHLLVHYITNCGYFGLIFLFNMAVFGVVTQKSCSLQNTGAVQGHRKPWKVALVAAGLFCLLGATWALAFLTYGISSAAVLYIFTILNSLQGIFIFIWLVVLYYPKTKETTGSLSYITRHDKTTTASQD